MRRSTACWVLGMGLVQGIASAVAAPTPQAEAGAESPAGWVCQTGSRRWLQFFPCPTTTMRASAVDVNGVDSRTGDFIHGIGTVDVPTAVESTPLTRAGVCLALGDPSIRVHHSGSSDVYERNKLKSQYCY